MDKVTLEEAVSKLNTYDQPSQVCPHCGHKGEMVYHQYIDWWTCQWCGWDSENGSSDLSEG